MVTGIFCEIAMRCRKEMPLARRSSSSEAGIEARMLGVCVRAEGRKSQDSSWRAETVGAGMVLVLGGSVVVGVMIGGSGDGGE